MVQNGILGPANQMGHGKPTEVHGKYEGGTAFERSTRVKPIQGGPRSYGLGTMLQTARTMDAPSANAKISDGNEEDEEAIQLHRKLLNVRRIFLLTYTLLLTSLTRLEPK